MVTQWRGHPLFPIVLGCAMLVVVIAAILPPNFGAEAVQFSCTDSDCTSAVGNAFLWNWMLIGAAIILAALIPVALSISLRPARTRKSQRRGPGENVNANDCWSPPPFFESASVETTFDTNSVKVETTVEFGSVAAANDFAGNLVADDQVRNRHHALEGRIAAAEIDSILAEIDNVSKEIVKRG